MGIYYNKHGMSGTPLHTKWRKMRERCNSKSCKDYKNYGDRGIKITKKWFYFEDFYNWAISNGYSSGLTIDRIDNNGGYCPENCQFITMKENQVKDRKGEKCYNAKLPENKVREIFDLCSSRNYTQQQAANIYGVTRANISAILVGRSWKHLNLRSK